MQRPPSAIACSGCSILPDAISICVPDVVAIFAASILVNMPPRDNSDPAAPAMPSISEVTDSTIGISFALGFRRARVIKPVDIGQQDQQIGARHGGDARGEAIIVAIADFVGRNRVVLVDPGHRPPFQQFADGRAGVEIAAPFLVSCSVTKICPAPMPCAPSTSDQIRASAICPTAAAPWLSSSFRGPRGNFRRLRPSAIEPDETTRTSRPSPCSLAISAASADSHAARTSPAWASIRSEEPTLTTMRRKFLSAGRFMMRSNDAGGREAIRASFRLWKWRGRQEAQVCISPAAVSPASTGPGCPWP